MSIQSSSIEWAIDFLDKHSDGDLFPRMPEIVAAVSRKVQLSAELADKHLTDFPAGACRRFVVPKEDVSFRQATQLDLQDSIILTAIMYEYGGGIEQRRLPSDQVFSYRFKPSHAGGLYGSQSSWNDFWSKADSKAQDCETVVHCDITDFYNQIYHHVAENQLAESGLPNQAIKWLVKLLESTTQGVSRGVPVGPHGAHLIAEATLVPIDNALRDSGLNFIRYVDDIIIFADDARSARISLRKVAGVLDKHQRLTLQRQKTRLFAPDEFRQLCASMIEDRPINQQEKELLRVIRQCSGGNPYKAVAYNKIPAADRAKITDEAVADVVREYLSQDPVDYHRLRWFYRRLSQVGHPGALEITLDNIERLGPCFANLCSYLTSIQTVGSAKWMNVGERLLELLASEEVQSSEYFRLSILSLFSRNAQLNHFGRISDLYQSGDPFVRREVILAAATANAVDWLRNFKEDYGGMGPWQRSAYVFAISGLPRDEKKFFLNRQGFYRPFDEELMLWSRDK